ncbi:O-antigen ligase family protein [Desulfonatronum thioautotrophicum]|uniref:O-antigen ligase family protein n=1 Tax=Desulfonatronum thioautotrophicum TaxID=617001 RepID=UPI00137935B1|nr:O-antigen ligase family protein [Desulfonatronum thioautotrophicum]
MAAYVLVLLGPQHIWWWAFEGLRPFQLVALATIAGFVLAIARHDIGTTFLKTRINLFLVILLACMTLSYLFGPYVEYGPGPRHFDPAWLYKLTINIFLFYFIAVLCINDDRKFRYLSLVMVFSVAYLIYWINKQYLTGMAWGRIGGPWSPAGGHFTDENFFALLVVMGLPFLYFLGFYYKNLIIRYGLWLIIPFGWHAVFLTGSRGGLIGLATILAITVLRSPKKWIGVLLIPLFIVAYQWQAGDVMRDRAQDIRSVDETTTAQTRFQAWNAGLEMMKAHPLIGVGLASFGPAFPNYSPYPARVAHNAYIEVGAENGVLAFIVYIGIYLTAIMTLWRKKPMQLWMQPGHEKHYLYLMNEALLVSFVGFAVSALALSAHYHEGFFYLLILINFIYVKKMQASTESR